MSSKRHTFAAAIATMFAATCWATLNGQTGGYSSSANSLSGTYELDRSRSDDATRVAQQATRSLPTEQRDRAYQNLRARLEAPDQLTIDLQGRSVAIASSAAPRLDFVADGRNRTETSPNGRIITTRSDVRGQVLSVSTTGDRGNSYTVRFEPVSGGLRVTRTLDSDVRNSSVSSQSFYRRVSAQPSWASYNGRTPYDDRAPYNDRSRYGANPTSVRGGTVVTARLDNDLDSRTAREGDRFTMTVTGPSEYRNATLDGSVIRRQDVNGSDALVFDFDHIRINNRSMPFEGTIRSVRTPDGKDIRVTQGAVEDRSGYNAANAEHAAIGAGVGAIIGAIIGGGKGAAIGGATGGAGTLLIEGPEHLSLRAGSEMTISTIGPAPVARR